MLLGIAGIALPIDEVGAASYKPILCGIQFRAGVTAIIEGRYDGETIIVRGICETPHT